MLVFDISTFSENSNHAYQSLQAALGVQDEDEPVEADEYSPLLQSNGAANTVIQDKAWKPPPGFTWIEIAIFSNVFLSGFDGTISASTYAVIGSEFNAANTVSWLTTSYLITSTAFQPLYGRFSDIFGRRACFFTATWTFLLGCLGCGGGGLMTMATIINSDIIPFHERVPISIFAFIVGLARIKNVHVFAIEDQDNARRSQSVWKQTDLSGAILLVLGLSAQLAGLSMGGNNYPWSDKRVISSLVVSVFLLVVFVIVELKTVAIPVMPMQMLRGTLAISNIISNICTGMAAYAFLFMLPLFFQAVLGDSSSEAGVRLVIPSLATPVGGLIAGIVMSRVGRLSELLRVGCTLMTLGNALIVLLRFHDASWKYIVYLIPANFGQGISYPSMLFTFIAAFDHKQQAVSTSMVYLFRSLGTVWGVAASSTIIQNIMARQLPDALHGVPDAEKIIDEIRHSVTVLKSLPPEIQLQARMVYYHALRCGFMFSTGVAALALVSAFFARGQGLNRKKKDIENT
ncbi:putative mfs drug [Phaeomoniella chlamydospora]|uniref:Putative mfs drug n=1 Tax=Phaeomoniella chlamydospora TaxID=158046 RepID=A0A0G2G2Q5_PHACM|nr:putative mfs drug [Phaeomoniella chlamydospora]